jgi:hypothetical protein
MYDIHPDLLLAFERARQEQLQQQPRIQMLLRQAQINAPRQRGQWLHAGGECLRRLGLKLLAFLQPRSYQHPVTPVATLDMHQEEEHESVASTLSAPRVLEKTTV